MKTHTCLTLTMTAVLLLAAPCLAQMMGGGGYRPGSVRDAKGLAAPLDPPEQLDDDAFWLVEPEIRLHHFSIGSGTPILFVHGGPGFPTRHIPAGLKKLADDYEVHFYDQRGCGKSTRPFERFDMRRFPMSMTTMNKTLGITAQIADIERIRRILGTDKLILVGHSFGGFLASLYAVEFPERVAALVLIAPADMLVFPQQAADGGVFTIMRERIPEDRREEYDKFVSEYMDFSGVFRKTDKEIAATNHKFAEFFTLAEGSDRPPVQPVLEDCGGWMSTAIYFTLGMKYDLRDAVRAVHVPVLVLHGGRDLSPERVSRGYAECFPNARFELIPEGTHALLDDKPDEIATTVREFLASPLSPPPVPPPQTEPTPRKDDTEP